VRSRAGSHHVLGALQLSGPGSDAYGPQELDIELGKEPAVVITAGRRNLSLPLEQAQIMGGYPKLLCSLRNSDLAVHWRTVYCPVIGLSFSGMKGFWRVTEYAGGASRERRAPLLQAAPELDIGLDFYEAVIQGAEAQSLGRFVHAVDFRDRR
jgi:hypothetical protein